jgi:hypothetical protein
MKIKNTLLLIVSCLLLAACTASPTPTNTPLPIASTPTRPAPNVDMATATTLPTETKPAEPIGKVVDDFEASTTGWQPGVPPNYPDSSAKSISLSSDYAVQGKQSLALTFEKTDLSTATFILEGQFNVNGYSYLAFDLIDPNRAVEAVALSLSTGSDWTWHATSPVLPPTDATQITFDIGSSTFRVAASDWQPTAKLANPADVKRIAIILTVKTGSTVYMDNVRLLPAEALVSLPPTVQPAAGPTPTPGPCPGQAALPASDTLSASDTPLAISLPVGFTPTRGSLVEFDLQTSVQAANPYDPNEIDLMVRYTAPDGTKFSIPAFWMQNFDPATERPCGQAGWKARLNPTQSGSWIAQAEIVNQGITSEAITFDVAEPAEPPLSLIRLHPTDPRYLATEDGQTFFPIGLNIGWWQNGAIDDYTRWLDHFAPNGGNLIRVWMASWSFSIESSDTGLGNYDKRQDRAWMLDQLFQIAAERGVYIDLVILYHGAFSTNVNPEWSLNPYNVDNGGMCDSPACFATDEAAKEMFKHRLRYIAARWGYAPNLLTWEWWNEYNWTPITDKAMAAWIQEMTPYLLQFDPYDHLISTSSATGTHPDVFNLPELDFLYRHLYSPSDPIGDFSNQYQQYEFTIKPIKPVVFGEFGYGADGENQDSYDKTGIHLHNGLWAATFSQFASPAMYWWWDSYIEPLDLWWRFGNLHTFIKDVDPAQYVPLGPGKIHLSDSANAKLLALHSEDSVLVWVRQAKYEAYTVQTEAEKQVRYQKADPATLEYHLDPLSGLTLTTTALPDGAYTLEWYDPQTGTWQPPVNVTVTGGSLSVDVPTFEFDLALRIQPAP